MCWRRQVILIEHERTVAQRRSDLAHAIAHLDLEHRGDTFNRHHEEAANRYAANLLIDVRALADAISWSQDGNEVADALRVDIETLRLRMKHLHPSERAYLRQWLNGV